MAELMMSTFADPRDYYSLGSQPSTLSSSSGHFDTSFSSLATSFDPCYTPSRRNSAATIDMDGLSSSRTSLGSNGSNSPVDDAMFYPMTSMTHNMKAEIHDLDQMYGTPCSKGFPDHNMMSYDYSQVRNMYGPLDCQEPFDILPGMMFDGLAGPLFENPTPPLPLASSPTNFVIPSQTFLSEPYRPTTPTGMKNRIQLGSPLTGFSQPSGDIKYFMSPRDTGSQTSSSHRSSPSQSTLERTPSSRGLENSAALRRIQAISGNLNRKQSRRQQRVTAKIERVAAGLFHCDHPGCKSEHGFKRHEHLKRHQRTHAAQKLLQCNYCTKKFQLDRSDNYRSHVRLHTQDKKGSRTKYCPEAKKEVESWDNKERHVDQKLGVPGEMYRVYTRRGRASQKTPSTTS